MIRSLVRATALVFVSGLLLVPRDGVAQGVADSTARRIDALFARFDSTTPGCLVGVGRNGTPVFKRGYGMANLEYGVPLTANSISESGSVAKQFTAAAVALLQLEGKLSLDDEVRKYIPELPDFGQRITIRHILTMTSGLRDQWALLGLMGREPGSQVHTNTMILDLVARQRELNFAPGSEYLYSNTGYVLAATIVSRVSGMPFAQFEQERLFKPLGMTHTQWRDDYRRVVPARATAYAFERGKWVQDMPFTMVHGNGGLLSSLDDLLAWNESLSNGLLGRPELTQLLETRMRLNDGRTLTYALGLQVNPWRDGVREVSHSGSTAGYRTFLARYPEARTSVAVWCNAANANAVQLGRAVAELFVPRATATRVAATPIAVAERDRIVGMYRAPRTDDGLAIATVGEFARVMGPSNDSLSGTGSPGTYATPSGMTLRFTPADGKATALRVTAPDGEVTELVAATPPTTASLSLGDYAGSYRSPELDARLVVRLDGARLLARISPDDELPLVPYYADGFRMGPATLRFVRDASGNITGLRAFAGRARNVRYDREREAPPRSR
ncbi:MAG: serine hydrolase [Gemmatimonadaceae bacterium]|nr:serine hydrolase [Gemmatimonadaceae bacterium]